MTCSETRQHLMDHAWQRLPAAEAGAVDRHLAGCPACRALLDEERAVGDALAALPVAAPRRDLWMTVRARQMGLDTVPDPPGRTDAMAPVFAWKAARQRAWRTWGAALGTAAAVLALMLAPGRRAVEPGSGARVIAQTLATAGQVDRQSDDPLAAVSDTTWDALGVAVNTPKDRPS